MIDVEFLGAAGGVTGSMHLVRTSRARVLLECGLFQGRRHQANQRNRNLRVPRNGRRGRDDIDAAVLSHAHIDHSGALPVLYKRGYRGAVYATPATRDLCAVMLDDAAAIQLHDAQWINSAIRRGESTMEPVEPLYDHSDVSGLLSQMVGLPYRRRQTIAEGVDLTFYDAGHVLGSALVVLDIDDEGAQRRLVFTGDLGRRAMPILRDPDCPTGAEILIMESTYGDRLHEPIEDTAEELAGIIRKTAADGGKVVIPSFALERAQEIVFALRRLHDRGKLPDIPVYVDSPLTVRITDVFRMHPECYDADASEVLRSGRSPFEFPGLRYVSEVSDSKRIDATPGPAVIISASGMCEFGRVVHHLKAIVSDPNSTVVIVGFQAQHTLGRRFVEQRQRVRILGVEWDRACKVRVLNGFSAHADRGDLISFAEKLRETGPLRHVALVHGEEQPRQALRAGLEELGFPSVQTPNEGERLSF